MFQIKFDLCFDRDWPTCVHVALGRELHVDWDACVRVVHVHERDGAAFVVKELVALADAAEQQRLLHIYTRLDALAAAPSLERPIAAFRSSTQSLCLLLPLYANVVWADVAAPRRRAAMWRIAADLTDALARLSGAGVVHRNVTLGNVLLDDALRLRLIDLGDAALVDDAPLDVVTNRLFAAPDDVHTPAADVFSAGCVLAALYLDSGDALFDGERRDDVLAALGDLRDDGAPPAAAEFWCRFNDRIVASAAAPRDADFEGLLWRMLAVDPDRRISAPEAHRRCLSAIEEV